MSDETDGGSAAGGHGRHVLILITGGTICMQDSPNGLVPTKDFVNNCLRPKYDFNDGTDCEPCSVIDDKMHEAPAPTLRPPRRNASTPNYRYSVLEFSELFDSSSMDGSHWNTIIRCLDANWTRFDAFVILHGTDTLAYTASAMSFMLGHLDKTVIVTGSQLSMYAPHNDAHDNLLDSLTAAASFDIPEVCVVFHHHLYRATRVTKISAFSMAGFTTPNAKPLATFPKHEGQQWEAHVYSHSIRPTTDESHDALTRITSSGLLKAHTGVDTSRVAVLKVYPGISSVLINTVIHIPNLGGLVLETFGAGNVPLGAGSNILQILSEAVSMGIVVVSVTQCLTGSVTSAYESANRMEKVGVVTGLDMTTEAAYTKLAYLLSLSNLSRDEMVKLMRQNLRGELTADFRVGQRKRDSFTSDRPKVFGP